jgi:dTDP-4-dehydrorhamnose reductase
MIQMSIPLIVVTGKNGQLGWELQQVHNRYSVFFYFLFTDREELDLADLSSIPSFFEKYKPAYFINCAAYTAVDKAETEQEAAYTINAEAVNIIAQQCKKWNCTLIHISTDYVFDGKGTVPYTTDTKTEPVNYYGYSKWVGEKLALENNDRSIIIRTSWLYSSQGNNFVKTMLRLMKERTALKVVDDQVGSPTYAADLALSVMKIIQALENGNRHFGIYHYSNEGVTSWFEFATAIKEMSHLSCEVLPIPTSAYPTPAKRPAYSVMDTSDINKDFGIEISNWKSSLETCLQQLEK